MAYYRLYCLNEQGNIYHCEEISADDDIDAVRQARRLMPDTAAELWQGARKVHSFQTPTWQELSEG